jgi:hypothetical protein
MRHRSPASRDQSPLRDLPAALALRDDLLLPGGRCEGDRDLSVERAGPVGRHLCEERLALGGVDECEHDSLFTSEAPSRTCTRVPGGPEDLGRKSSGWSSNQTISRPNDSDLGQLDENDSTTICRAPLLLSIIAGQPRRQAGMRLKHGSSGC